LSKGKREPIGEKKDNYCGKDSAKGLRNRTRKQAIEDLKDRRQAGARSVRRLEIGIGLRKKKGRAGKFTERGLGGQKRGPLQTPKIVGSPRDGRAKQKQTGRPFRESMLTLKEKDWGKVEWM